VTSTPPAQECWTSRVGVHGVGWVALAAAGQPGAVVDMQAFARGFGAWCAYKADFLDAVAGRLVGSVWSRAALALLAASSSTDGTLRLCLCYLWLCLEAQHSSFNTFALYLCATPPLRP